VDFWTTLKIWVKRSSIWRLLIVYLIIVLAVKIIGGTFYRQLTVFQALGIAIIFLFLAYVYLNFIRKPKIIEKGFAQIILLGAIATIVALITIGFLLYQRGLLGKFITSPKDHPTPAPTKQITSSQTDETANWKTYTGNAFESKFTFQYPPSLNLKFQGPEGGGTVFANSNDLELLTIYYNNKPSIQSLKDFATEAATNSVYGGGKKLIRQSTIKVAGYEAFKNEIQMENGQLELQVFIMDPKRNDSGYDNLYNIQNPNPNQLSENEFDRILLTFKFLD